MLEQIANAITFAGHFTESKLGKTGLTVTVDVYRDTTQVVTGGSATEVGGGLYKYALASGSVTTEANYYAIFKTATTSVDQQHIPALWVVGTAGVEHLDAAISACAAASTALSTATWTNAKAALIDVALSSLAPASTALSTAVWTGTKAGYLDASVNSRMATFTYTAPPSAADVTTEVWGATTRALTDKSGFALSTAGVTAVQSGLSTLSTSDVAGAVWGAATRTLTSSSGGATAAEVWAYTTRTLTALPSPAPTGYGGEFTGEISGLTDGQAAMLAAVHAKTQLITTGGLTILSPIDQEGDRITGRIADTWVIELTGVGELTGVDELWFSVKLTPDSDEAASLFLSLSEGLVRINGSEAPDASQGSVVVEDATAGNVRITVDESITSQLWPTTTARWALKQLLDGATTTLTAGDFTIQRAEIVAIS